MLTRSSEISGMRRLAYASDSSVTRSANFAALSVPVRTVRMRSATSSMPLAAPSESKRTLAWGR